MNASRLTVSGRPRSQGATRTLDHRGPGRGGETRSLHRLPGPLEPVQIRVRRLALLVRIAVSVFGDIEHRQRIVVARGAMAGIVAQRADAGTEPDRSGSTLLMRMLAEHPDIIGLKRFPYSGASAATECIS